MDSFDEERSYWKKLYDDGEINEATYIRNIEVINRRNEFSSNNSGYSDISYNSKNKFNKQTKISKIIFVLMIALVVFFLYKFRVNKEYIAVNNLGELSEPEQHLATGTVVKIIDDTEINIKYVASYKICGRVVKTYSYPQVGIQNKLSPVDVGLTWGFLAKDENNSKVTWGNTGNRFLSWTVYDNDWYNFYGTTTIREHLSNNHLIPADDDILRKIKAIREDEYILITGYLVNATYKVENGTSYWNSSTSRLDTGDGACEIIYVTSVEWLTEASE